MAAQRMTMLAVAIGPAVLITGLTTASATAWRVSGTVLGIKRTARLTTALKNRLRPHLPPRPAEPRLTVAQIKRAQAGVPNAAARWAPTVERYWSRWRWRRAQRRLTVTQLNRALWVI